MTVKRVLQPLLLGATLFLIYAALRQRVLYGDGVHFLLQLRIPFLAGHNWLYLPVLAPFVRGLAALGVADHTAAAIFSGVCVAGGGAFLFALLRAVSEDMAAALIATLLVALSPALLFYGTTVENHAHHFLWVCACLWLVHRAASARAPWLFAAAGFALAGAYASHQTAVLLVPSVLLLAVVWTGGSGGRGFARHCITLSVLLAPLIVAKLLDRWVKTTLLGGGPAWSQDEGLAVFKQVVLTGEPPSRWLAYWRDEFLAPAFGLVAAATPALVWLVRRSPGVVLAVIGGAVPYLLFFARWGVRERGAYYTAVWPLLAIAVTLAVSATRWRKVLLALLAVLVAAQCLCGLREIRTFEQEDTYRQFVDEVSGVVPPDGVLLTADSFRSQHVRYWLRLESWDITKLLVDTAISEIGFPGAIARFPADVARELGNMVQNGRAVVIEKEAWTFIEQRLPELAALLDRRFRRAAVGEGAFVGFRLVAL